MEKKFTWDLGYYCNFQCSYCFHTGSDWEDLQKKGTARPVEEIERSWKHIFDKYGESFIYITGGEPFAYPDFIEIIKFLIKYHKLHVTTNLSYSVEEVIATVPPEKVEFNCTFHPQFTMLDNFAVKVTELKKNDFTAGVCYLAHPSQLREMLVYKKIFKISDIDMSIDLFWGNYMGAEYPVSYTDEQKKYIEYTMRWRPQSKSPNIIYDKELNRDPEKLSPVSMKNKFCSAGCDYAAIKVDGTITRCGQLAAPVLGNLYESRIDLLDNSYECKNDFCRSKEIEYTD